MAYLAFGGLAVSRDGVVHRLLKRRERNVLAALLAAHGAPVAADRLVVDIWGERAPPRAFTSLQVAVSHLRSSLEPDRAARSPARLHTRAVRR